MTPRKSPEILETVSFESAFTELQDRVTQLEKGDLSLEETIEQFREATRLTQSLERLIIDAELRITELSSSDDPSPVAGETGS